MQIYIIYLEDTFPLTFKVLSRQHSFFGQVFHVKILSFKIAMLGRVGRCWASGAGHAPSEVYFFINLFLSK